MNKTIKYFSSKAKETDDDRTLEFIGSDETIDRDNEVIKVSGWRLQNFKKNPVVLVNHNPHDLPVAKADKVWVDRENKQLKFKVRFPESDVSPQGDTLFKLYKGGFMSAVSVGFSPNREKMVFGDLERGEPRITFKEQELLELSLVALPANINARVTARKGFDDAIEAEVVDELEINDLKTWIKENFDLDLDAVEDDAHETEIKEDDPTDETIEKETENINTIENKCISCGVEITCRCEKCQEEKDTNDYYEKLYSDLMAEKQSDSSVK